jgi:hypothetical protein
MKDTVTEFGEIYNIPEKQIRILKLLRNKELTARQISKQADIPIGRLYDYINDLLFDKLIEKTNKKPAIYSFTEPEAKINNFIQHKFNETTSKESLMLSLLQSNPTTVRLLTTREDYISECRRIYNQEDKIFFIERMKTPPFYFYPEDNTDYDRVRRHIRRKRELILGLDTQQNLYKTNYFKNLNSGTKFIGVTNKKTLTEFFKTMKKALGEEKFKIQIKKIIQITKKDNVHCKLVDQEFPYYLVVTKNNVLMCLTSAGNVINLLINDKDVATNFTLFFESLYRDAKPIIPFLEKFL